MTPQMADWRLRDYVPDSDSEPDVDVEHLDGSGRHTEHDSMKTADTNQEPTRLSYADDCSGSADPTASQYSHHVHLDAATVRQPILPSSPQSFQHLLPDANHSPTSSLSSSLSSTLSDAPSALSLPPTLAHLTNSEESSNHAPPLDLQLPSSLDGPEDFVTLDGRRLRSRNAIQLNPYAVESELYKKIMRSRGVQPLHVLHQAPDPYPPSSSSSHVPFHDESLWEQTQIPPASQSSVGTVYDFVLPPGTPRQPQHSSPEVGSISALLETEWPEPSPKRRKIMPGHQSSRRNDPTVTTATVESAESAAQLGRSTEPHPKARRPQVSLNSLQAIPQFRPPPLWQPQAFSTEPSRRSTNSLQLATERSLGLSQTSSEESLDNREPSEDERSEATLSSPPDTDTGPSTSALTHKIRGVLPASWLRLDQKRTDAENTRAGKRDHTSPRRVNRPGVAKPISQRQSRQTTRELDEDRFNKLPSGSTASFESDVAPLRQDRSHSSGAAIPSASLSNSQKHHPSPNAIYIDSDSMEEDDIDRMLPLQRRKGPASRRRPKFRQPRLEDALERQRRKKARPSAQQTTTGNAVSHRTKRLRQRHLLGILDVAASTKSRDRPNFLRIAERTARSRKSQARHSPSRKTFRMSSNQDDQDIAEALDRWRAGEITSRRESGQIPQARPPLEVLSVNRQLSRAASPARERPKGLTSVPRTYANSARLQQSRHQQRLDQCLGQKAPAVKPRVTEASTSPILPANRPQNPSRRVAWQYDAHPPSVPAQLESSTASLMTYQNIRQPSSKRNASPLHNLLRRRPLKPQTARKSKVKAVAQSSTRDAVRTSRPRKQTPQRRHPRAEAQGVEHELSIPDDGDSAQTPSERGQQTVLTAKGLQGLLPYGTHYPISFDIRPLENGPVFGAHTFLGSGCLADILQHPPLESLDVQLPQMPPMLQGSWSEGTAIFVRRLFEEIQGGMTAAADSSSHDHPGKAGSLTLISRYICSNGNFPDSLVRNSFLEQMQEELEALLETTRIATNLVHALHVLMRSLPLLWQLHSVAAHKEVSTRPRSKVGQLLKDACLQVLRKTVYQEAHELRRFLRDLRILPDQTPLGLGALCAEALTVSIIILQQMSTAEYSLQSILQELYQSNIKLRDFNAVHVDLAWQDIFTVLPFQRIDKKGHALALNAEQTASHAWGLIKMLIAPVLVAYDEARKQPGTSLNAYVRALFTRCFELVSVWNWSQPEIIISYLFDFFAGRHLAHLDHEECHGSPAFLQDLRDDLVLDVQNHDRCFHVLLKLVGTGLQRMRTTYKDSKIGNIAWRLMPNHDRQLLRDQEVRQDDLDALRNHHDLLSVLYWAAPPGSRLGVHQIRRLVDLECSHREACRISMRTWSNLLNYKLSSCPTEADIRPFRDWLDHMLQRFMQLHTHARFEVETHDPNLTTLGFSKEARERVIAANQKQLESLLIELLGCLQLAIKRASTAAILSELLTPQLGMVMRGFRPSSPRADRILLEVLHCIDACLSCAAKLHGAEESQDYGDWSVFEELLPEQAASTTSFKIDDTLEQGIFDLLATAFASDGCTSDSLMEHLLQTWTRLAASTIEMGKRSWDEYLGSYGKFAWNGLDLTQTASRYKPLFLAKCVQHGGASLQQHRQLIFTSWMHALVQPQPTTVHAHRLTEAIMNQDMDVDLLENLPFWRNASGSFEVTASSFTDRRLALIGSLLSNMRHVVALIRNSSSDQNLLGRMRDITENIRALMTSMKQACQWQRAGTEAQIAYMSFVHEVVGLLQQHVADICPIDRYFTDAVAFPLPQVDPTYLASRLKSYGLRIAETRTLKELGSFLISAMQRAIVDGTESQFSAQLQAALTDGQERLSTASGTLFDFIANVALPALVEIELDTLGSFCLAAPVFEAMRESIRENLPTQAGLDTSCLRPHAASLGNLLRRLQTSAELLVKHLDSSSHVDCLSRVFALITAALPPLDYLLRLGVDDHVDSIVAHVAYFFRIAMQLAAHLLHNTHVDVKADAAQLADAVSDGPVSVNKDSVAVSFSNSLRNMLTREWKSEGNKQWVMQRGVWREVVPRIGSIEDERIGLQRQLEAFLWTMAHMPAFEGLGNFALAEQKEALSYDCY